MSHDDRSAIGVLAGVYAVLPPPLTGVKKRLDLLFDLVVLIPKVFRFGCVLSFRNPDRRKRRRARGPVGDR